MVDVFISYPRREKALMLPIRQRLEALGLIVFVDVDGQLDGEATFPDALDKGVRASKVVLGCWSPWALGRPWVQIECAIGKDENKLVAVELVALSAAEVPALFYLVDRKPLADFDGTSPHEGWAMTLSAIATKLKIWADKRPNHSDVAAVREKISVLNKAADIERAAIGPLQSRSPTVRSPAPTNDSHAAEKAWEAIERSLDIEHYRRFVSTFQDDANAFVRLIEAEARCKSLERWAATNREDRAAIAELIRTGPFPALLQEAQNALWQRDCDRASVAAREATEMLRVSTLSSEEQELEALKIHEYLQHYTGEALHGLGLLHSHFDKHPSIDPRRPTADQKYAGLYESYLAGGDYYYGDRTSDFRDILVSWRQRRGTPS